MPFCFVLGVKAAKERRRRTLPLGLVCPASWLLRSRAGSAHLSLVTAREGAVLCGLRRPRAASPQLPTRVGEDGFHLPVSTVHPFTRDVLLLAVYVPLVAFRSH